MLKAGAPGELMLSGKGGNEGEWGVGGQIAFSCWRCGLGGIESSPRGPLHHHLRHVIGLRVHPPRNNITKRNDTPTAWPRWRRAGAVPSRSLATDERREHAPDERGRRV
ncbi:hypothetical protein B0H11DRAFT_2272127, partial [Mycena galericulata]